MLFAGIGLIAAVTFYLVVIRFFRRSKPAAPLLYFPRPTFEDFIHECKIDQPTARSLTLQLAQGKEVNVAVNGQTYRVRCSRS